MSKPWRVCFRSMIDGSPVLEEGGLDRTEAERRAAWMTAAYRTEHYAEPDDGTVMKEAEWEGTT